MFVKFICKFKSDWGNSAAAVRIYKLIIFRCFHVFICLFFTFLFPFHRPQAAKRKICLHLPIWMNYAICQAHQIYYYYYFLKNKDRFLEM